MFCSVWQSYILFNDTEMSTVKIFYHYSCKHNSVPFLMGFTPSLTRRDFQYFPNLQLLEDETIADGDIDAYVPHLDKLTEDLK